MSATWTIKRIRASESDVARTLEGWDIIDAVFSLVSFGRDTMRITQTKPIDEEDDFTNEDIVRLYRDGVQVFMGVVVRPVSMGTGSSEQRVTVIFGPWFWAETTPCQLDWAFDGDLEKVAKIGQITVYMDADGIQQNIGNAMTGLVDDLIATGAPWSRGFLDGRGVPPPRYLENVSYSEVFQMVVECVPDMVAWFDYQFDEPRFNMRDPDQIVPIDIPIETKPADGSPRLAELPEVGRHDYDKVPYVEIQLKSKSKFDIVIDGTGATEPRFKSHYDKYRHPLAPDARGGIVVKIDETDPMVPNPEIPGTGWNALAFAQRAYEAFSGMLWRGSFVMVGDDIDARLRPGLRVNFTEGRESWESMNGLVQQVEHNIFAGRSTAVFGPPLQISPSDYVDKLIALRRQLHITNDNLNDRKRGYTATFDEEQQEEAGGGRVKLVTTVETEAGGFVIDTVTLPRSATRAGG